MRLSRVVAFLVILSVAGGAFLLLRPRGGPPRCPDCNVILVSIDTLRADHVGCYGYVRDTTSSIDAFAAGDAVLFENAVAQGSTTSYSHGSMLTGVIPQHHGASWKQLRPLHSYVPTLAEMLTVDGFLSVSFNGGGLLATDFGFDRGFAVYDSDGQATLSERADAFARWFEKRRAGKLFVFLHTYEVHSPYAPAARFVELFDRGYDGPLPNAISSDFLNRVNVGEIELDAEDARHVVDLYDADIRSADEAFGRFLSLLRRAGLYDDTLLILTADHGEELGEHGKIGWHSHALWDEILRVPLLIKFPHSWKGGTRVQPEVSHVDLVPTIFDVLGVEPRWRFDGRSVVPLVASGRADGERELVVSQCDDGKKPLTSIRSMRWKLLMREGSGDKTLFDLERDPGEHDDVAAAHPTIVAKYDAAYRRVREERKKIVFRMPVPVSEEAEAILRSLGYRR